MFKTLCGIAWNTELVIVLVLLFLLSVLYLIVSGANFLFKRKSNPDTVIWHGRNYALVLCALSLALFATCNWGSEQARCFVARVVRNQVSRDIVGEHFPKAETLRDVSKTSAEMALARCDEDRWEAITRISDGHSVQVVMRCLATPTIELWADHFHHWNGLRDPDVYFTACRSGKCTADKVLVPSTE